MALASAEQRSITLFLRVAAPFFAVSILCSLPNFGMSVRQEQRIRVANVGPDQAEVAGRIEQAGIPAFPIWQHDLNLFAQIHWLNVYEPDGQNNDAVGRLL